MARKPCPQDNVNQYFKGLLRGVHTPNRNPRSGSRQWLGRGRKREKVLTLFLHPSPPLSVRVTSQIGRREEAETTLGRTPHRSLGPPPSPAALRLSGRGGAPRRGGTALPFVVWAGKKGRGFGEREGVVVN